MYRADDDDDVVDAHKEGFPPVLFVTAVTPKGFYGPIWARHLRRRVFMSCAPSVACAQLRDQHNFRPRCAAAHHEVQLIRCAKGGAGPSDGDDDGGDDYDDADGDFRISKLLAAR